MNLNFESTIKKNEVFNEVESFFIKKNYKILTIDKSRPWGGFFVLDENQADKFKQDFFSEVVENEASYGKLSPKILIVEAGKRLSWQYHHRRSEIWKVIGGKAGVKRSFTGKEGELEIKNINDVITLQQGERHRLIGLESWGIIAEIWQHSDANNPSNEDDIVRVQDDFGR